jgi:hypothetical protein
MMNQNWIALIVFVVTFVCGILGLALQRWPPERHMSDDTRDLINRVTGLVGTMTALVLGLLIASANSFYNTQKSNLEVTASKLLQLDGVLRRYGPEAAPARAQLKAAAIQIYEDDWGHGSETPPTVVDSSAAIDVFAKSLDSLNPTTEAERFRHSRANEIAASIVDQRLLTSLQISNSISWPFLIILVSWTSLLFFGFGITVRRNGTSIATLAVAAFAVASAVFLIVELSEPYSGWLRLPSTPLAQAIDALGQ